MNKVIITEKRRNLCASLIKNGERTVRDGVDHSADYCRCIVHGGLCVGYYAVLIDYNPESDMFMVGFNKWVPASQVDEIAIFDAVLKFFQMLRNCQ